jgi:hypothetical protein
MRRSRRRGAPGHGTARNRMCRARFALVNGVSFEFARSIFTGEANLTKIIGGMFGLQARPDSNTKSPPFCGTEAFTWSTRDREFGFWYIS